MDDKQLWKSSKKPSSDNKSKFVFSNAQIADTFIEINNIGLRIVLVLHLLISVSLFWNVEYWLGLLVFIVGIFIIYITSSTFVFLAEIYRHLKEINNKTKHPDKD
ncbi:MAG: hypothetical protein CMQ56_02175 [Gammaproteobacteria bacterium]|nr:hypothetical protein [Gammaproteobacteria bacterium]|tara:strand:- start:103 stop:417 length:315 start_codon:yes stop_codon:yes gene_type:complete